MKRRLTRSAFHEIRKRPGVMVAYFALRRAVRNTAQFRENAAGLVVVIVDKDWGARFQRAAELLLSGQRRAFFNAETSQRRVIVIDAGNKRRNDLDVLRAHAQTIVIAASAEPLPRTVRLAADVVLSVEKPTVRHVAAVRKLTGRMPVDEATALRLLAQDWSVIDALLCRQNLNDFVVELTADGKDSPLVSGPCLSALPGLVEVRKWASELSVDFSSWRQAKLAWSQVDKAALLIGPPGVGKTMCAGALAAELGIPIIATSAGRWQSAGEGHLGDMLRAMRASFEEARCRAPAVLFIDELDSVGSRDHESRYKFYETQVVNTFLELTSTASTWPGVILLAATNRIQNIEGAILRSGRFETHIFVDLPTPSERASILSHHLDGFPVDLLRPHTDQLHSASPADLELLSRSIKRHARQHGRAVEVYDVQESMPRRRAIPEDVLHRIAAHECGHAIVALASGFVNEVSISISETVAEGFIAQTGGKTEYEMKDSMLPTEDLLRAQIRIALAGMAAEEIGIGNRSTGGAGISGSDLDVATGIATRMVASYGMAQVPRFYVESAQVGRRFRVSPRLSDEVDRILGEEWSNAKKVLTEEWGKLLNLILDLLERKLIRLDHEGRAT